MDPRQQQQHPFSRTATSPYTRNPPYSAPGQPYTPSSHAPSTNPPYADHHRRPSDPPYANYVQHRTYSGDNQMRDGPVRDGPHRDVGMRDGPARDAPIRDPAIRDGPMREGPIREAPMSGHSRHQSSSSVGHTPVNRGMPPPSSPQQNSAPRYGQLPPTRAPAPGPPNFGSGRELPALGATPGHTSRVSIADLLGGPSSAAREQPERSYGPASSAPSQAPTYAGAAQASPRMTTAPDYAPFRRPSTPEHARSEHRGYEPRDHRANSAGSPPRPNQYSPDARRYGTPQSYGQRTIAEERRDPPNRTPNSNTAVPPRPSSQPGSYNPVQRSIDPRPPPPALNDSIFGRQARSETLNREAYRNDYEERHNAAFAYAERARQEREANLLREREQREQREQREKHELREQQERRELNEQKEREHRARLMSEQQALQQDYANKMAAQRAQVYNRGPESREQPAWLRHGYEPPRPEYEPIPEQQPHQREPMHNYPRTTAPSYGGAPAYSNNEHRFPPVSQPAAIPVQHNAPAASPFEAALQQERQRIAQQQHEDQQRAIYGGPPQNAAYQQESPTKRFEDVTRRLEEAQQLQQVQRSFLGVQEMNRKGRISPLPQAVQGAQGQIGGPGGEPGIKHEFGRMFSGIGSGVGALEGRSPVTAGPQGLSMSGQLRREDTDGFQGESPIENGGFNIARSSSRGGRRRKLKEEDGRGDDDSSTGRRTPSGSGRGKRLKHHHNHRHGQHHHQHHHRVDQAENVSSPLLLNHSPFKIARGTVVTSPPDAKIVPAHHHHAVRHHHHHQATPSKPEPPKNIPIPIPKITIRSKAVLDSVAHLPRNHLGHSYYQSELTPVGKTMNSPRARLGFASTPQPLPLFEGSENSTFTIRVPRIHLTEQSRREITARRAVWGTDVYTDDSDVIAACIHHGWFRGCWSEDVDVSLLGLELGDGNSPSMPPEYLTEPPMNGPTEVPKDKDLHVTILVLPKLEKYSAVTRFGMRSREWGANREGYKGHHDGLSFMILSCRWLDGDELSASRSFKEIKKLRPVAMEQWEIDAEREWGEQLLNAGRGMEGLVVQESFERGGEGRFGDLKGIGGKSWWVKPLKKVEKVEEEPVRDKESEIRDVADKMIENVNGHLKENVADAVAAA